jgi:ferredoxin/flavodoxin---NADP+ reductase
MSALGTESVLSVHHWNNTLFSFRTTRDPALRFENGHFVMIGLEVDSKPLMRAYSIVSANHDEHLEFLSIKVPDGPLTSRLQHLKVGDSLIVSRKPVGTLVMHDLRPGKHLYLLGTGTGLAPFMSIIRDPEAYERFDKIVLVHGVREVSELAYHDYLTQELPAHEFLGEAVRAKLLYYRQAHRRPRPAAAKPRDRPRDALWQPGNAPHPHRPARRLGLPSLAQPGCAGRLCHRARFR